MSNVTITGNLSSVGDAFLGHTNIAGKLTVGTMVFDDIDESINTIGPLKLQNSPLAGTIELFGGTIKLARNGDLVTEGTVSAKEVKIQELTIKVAEEATGSATPSSIGQDTIEAGNTSVTIKTTKVKQGSKVFLTPRSSTSGQALVVDTIDADRSFTVSLDYPLYHDVLFDWWIVQTKSEPQN